MSEETKTETEWQVEVFYDGQCPLCRREISMLRRLDRKKRIRFTDIASEEFSPKEIGVEYSKLMAEIHGRLPDGRLITGVEVFRRLYGAIGLRWLIPATRLPGVRHLLDFGYALFARNRLKLTGRCNDQCQVDA